MVFNPGQKLRLFNKDEKLKAQRRGIKAIGEAYGDGMLYSTTKTKKAYCTQLDIHLHKTTKA
jgi:hypothetical protein